jgi:hypothetical protein
MKKKLLKTLLLAVGLLVGGNAWATDMTTMTGLLGLTDNSNGFGDYHSKPVTLAAGESYVYTFVNYNKGTSGTDEWENWAVEATNGSAFLDFRADGGFWGALPSATNYTGSVWSAVSATKTTWLEAYNGVTVTVTVSRSNDGTTFTVAHTATLNTSGTYAGTYTATIAAADAITFYLTNEDSHQYITKVDCNGTQFNYVSSESAYTDQANATTNYNGASVDNLKIYYTQFRDWGSSDGTVKVNAYGKIAFYKFDLTEIKSKLATDGGTITGVTFSVYGKGNGGDCGRVRVLGYNSTWDASTINNGNVSNSAGTITGLVTSTGSFQPLNTTTERTLNSAGVTLSENTLTYVNSAIAENKDYVSFAITANYTREGLMNTFANLSFTYSAAVLYEATFSETNSLNPTVTVYTDDSRTIEIAKNELEANTTYYYRAVLAGYNDYEGSFDVATSNPTVNFTMTIKPRYTFTVNAVNSVGSAVIQALYTDDDSYDGKTHNVSFPAYLTGVGNAVTYSKDNSTYYQSYTSASADATKTQSYTAYTGEAYFFEGEDVTGAVRYTGASFGPRSSNGAAGFLNAKTVMSLDAGIYKITARSIGRSDHTHSIYKTSTEGEKIFDIDVSTTGTIKSAIISLDATTDIVANGGYSTTSDNGSGFDYFLIEKDPSVSVSVTAAGYATYVPSYDLDFTDSEIKAYKVKVASKGVATLTKVDNVPAGTPVLLYKDGGATEDIPVMTGATAVSENDLVAGTGAAVATTDGDYTNMILNNRDGIGFYFAAGQYVATNRAYLHIATSLAPDTEGDGARMMMVFTDDEETTGIESLTPALSKGKGVFYNLNGQRMNTPKKGLYIKGGKKVVVR